MTHFTDEKDEYLSVKFNELNLSEKEISNKVFEECTFNNCIFKETVFRSCKFVDCQFVKCDLSIVKLNFSRFSDVAFDECKIIGVNWTTVAWPSFALCAPIKFHQCILNDSTFFGLSLEEITIEDCIAHDVDFRDGNFSQANFVSTDFSNSLFNKTNLTGVDFIDATNYNIDINHNEIKSAKFCRQEAISLLDSLGIVLVD